jgi:hypothetical protein
MNNIEICKIENRKLNFFDKKYWFNEKGKLHKENSHARESWSGTKSWYKNDKYHREDGPAIIWRDGYTEYALYGFIFTVSAFYHKISFEEYYATNL